MNDVLQSILSQYLASKKQREALKITPAYQGLVEQGNLDISNRPRYVNPDGSISTVRSIGIGSDDKEIVIPTISPEGSSWSNEEAIDNYRRTGKHLGKFDSVENANSFSQSLHDDQARQVANKRIQANKLK